MDVINVGLRPTTSHATVAMLSPVTYKAKTKAFKRTAIEEIKIRSIVYHGRIGNELNFGCLLLTYSFIINYT